jgi:zinc protease
MLKSPAFKPAELKRASETLANSIEQMKEDAKSLALSGLKNSFFNPSSQNYDFDLDTLGTHIASCSITDLKKLHTLVLNAEWTVTVGGSANSVKTAEACINKLKPSKDLPAEESETTFIGTKGRQVVIIEVKSKQNIEFSIGGYLPLTLKDKELPAFMFGLSVLGKWGGFSGRLMSTVREKEGLTYGIYAQVQGLNVSRAGYWRIMTFFSPKDTVKGVTSTLREINLIQNKGITDGEVTRFQTILKTSDALLMDSLLSTTRLVHRVLVSGQTWADYQDFRQKLYTCTKTEVNKALKEYLDISELTISAAGPTTSVKKELESFKK